MPSEAFTGPVGEGSVEPRIPQFWFETHLDFVNHFTGQQHAVPKQFQFHYATTVQSPREKRPNSIKPRRVQGRGTSGQGWDWIWGVHSGKAQTSGVERKRDTERKENNGEKQKWL